MMRPSGSVFIEDSLAVAAIRMRENGTSFVPVIDGDKLKGAVTEAGLVKALAEGSQPTDSVVLACQPAPTCSRYTTGAEALRLLSDKASDFLIVVDDDGRTAGLLLPSALLQRPGTPVRPPTIGGMATPFGVYLTTGTLRGGVGNLALMTTGMSMSAMILVGGIIALSATDFAAAHGMTHSAADGLVGPLALGLFLLFMRLAPLSGIHAAEHKVVHAIERGEELTRETVRRMPRVHPRCGTNIAVGLSLFTGVFSAGILSNFGEDLRVVIALLVALAFWRPLGSFVQYWVTTKPPTDKQIDLGIVSGKDLLKKYEGAHVTHATFLKRLINTGVLHVLAGSAAAYFLVEGVLYLFGHGDLLKVY